MSTKVKIGHDMPRFPKWVPKGSHEHHMAILGKSGSGKTYCAKGVAEALIDMERRVCVIDPTGAWWGLGTRIDASHKAGCDLVVIGGDHGDLHLSPLSGEILGEAAASGNDCFVLDTSLMKVAERTKWFTDFATALFRKNQWPLYLFVDEAHLFAPQGRVPDPRSGEMLHAMNTIASGGRSRGIRLTMITQRPAKLHKDTLTCADTLVALRMIAPQDRAAIEDWVSGCGDRQLGREVVDSLASMPRGEGWVWYPEGGHLKRTAFPAISTIDSSATPTHDGAPRPERRPAADLEKLRAMLDAAVTDSSGRRPASAKADLEAAERNGRSLGFAEGYESGWDACAAAVAVAVATRPARTSVSPGPARVDRPVAEPRREVRPGPPETATRKVAAVKNKGQRGAEMRILRVLVSFRETGGLTTEQWAVLSRMKRTSGTWSTYVSRLRTAGLASADGGEWRATAAGIVEAGEVDAVRPRDVLASWKEALGGGPSKIIDFLLRRPSGATRAEVASGLDYSAKSGTFSTYLSRLSTSRVVVKSGDRLMINPMFLSC